MPNRREREVALIADTRSRLQSDAVIIAQYPNQPEKIQERMEERKSLADAIEAAHKREDAIRALPRFDYRECNSSDEFINADHLDAILDGEA